MGALDTYASEEHFADHLLPIYNAVRRRGDFIISTPMSQNPGRWPPATTKTTDPTRPVVVASYGDNKRMRKSGRERIAFIEHGAGQSYSSDHPSYAGGRDRQDVSLFLTPNDYSADLWRKAYPNARVEVVGCPKLDTLPRKDPNEPFTICVSFHWDCYLVAETVSAFQHYREVLPKLRDTYNLIGHGHPRAQVMLTRRYRRMNIPLVTTFSEVCRRADLYITDNSSSLFEFAATGRPVVVLNQPMYRKNIHHGLRFWDAANVGVQVDHPGDLLDAVALAIKDGPRQRKAREKALDLVYPIRTGAAERAARVLEDWA